MASSREIPYANKLILCMQALGYLSDPEGICFGMGHMAKQALLANKKKQFEKLIQCILNIPLDQFAETVEKAVRNPQKTN